MTKIKIGSAITGALLLLLSIGGVMYMNNQAQTERETTAFLTHVQQSKKEITDMLAWNFNNFNSITFEKMQEGFDDFLEEPGLVVQKEAGIVALQGYVNDHDADLTFSVWLDPQTGKLFNLTNASSIKGKREQQTTIGIGTGSMKLSDEQWTKLKEDFPAETKFGDGLFLGPEDIAALQAKGYTETITGDEIFAYWEALLNE